LLLSRPIQLSSTVATESRPINNWSTTISTMILLLRHNLTQFPNIVVPISIIHLPKPILNTLGTSKVMDYESVGEARMVSIKAMIGK
jgi:hypothetical protein